MTPGQKIVINAASCRHSATLIAPFIKADVLVALMKSLDSAISLVVYTRWRPEEVAAGVSDLEVFDILDKRPGSQLRLCDTLHAKLYRFDDIVLIGSANLTQAALGWSRRPNIELLRRVRHSPYLRRFEESLDQQSVPATPEIRAVVETAAKEIKRTIAFPRIITDDTSTTCTSAPWLPRLRRPYLFWKRYNNPATDLTDAASDQFEADAISIGAPQGLGLEALTACVRSTLLQHPFIAQIDTLVAQPQRFGTIRSAVRSHLRDSHTDRDSSEAAQTLIRWLLYFFPERYSLHTTHYSEILSRRI